MSFLQPLVLGRYLEGLLLGFQESLIDQAAPDDLTSCIKAVLDGRYRRGVCSRSGPCCCSRCSGILSGCLSSRDLEAFSIRHREALT